MDNLAKGFIYLLAMAWAGTETLLLASNGVYLPLYAALLIFAVGFVLVGCYPLSDSTVERLGKLFFAIVALSCLLFALGSLGSPLGLVKIAAAAILCLIVLRVPAPGAAKTGSHH